MNKRSYVLFDCSQSFKEGEQLNAKMLAEQIKEEAYNRGSQDNIGVLVVLFPGFGRLKKGKKKADIRSSTPSGSTPHNRSTSQDSHLSGSVISLSPLPLSSPPLFHVPDMLISFGSSNCTRLLTRRCKRFKMTVRQTTRILG